jgi:hypothetical protein
MRAVAVNVAANTNEPGFRGPIYPDGRFAYVPIPESEPTDGGVPTYADLAAADFGGPGLHRSLPESVRERPVHLDPEFAGYPACERYTYGDEHGVKAAPLSELRAGDHVFFYATLETVNPDASADWITPEWGAYLIGHFRLARDAVTGEAYAALDADERAPFANNAHVKRADTDARVFLLGDPEKSRLYERAVPLSTRTAGADANLLVTRDSADSGRGPWWRRPLRFDGDGRDRLLSVVADRAFDDCFADPA